MRGRRSAYAKAYESHDFNPRPARGRLQKSLSAPIMHSISIHAPARGAHGVLPFGYFDFNPRPPASGRPKADSSASAFLNFNPRPRGATDPDGYVALMEIDFNPRPREGARAFLIFCASISIHAPRGGDPNPLIRRTLEPDFNPRPTVGDISGYLTGGSCIFQSAPPRWSTRSTALNSISIRPPGGHPGFDFNDYRISIRPARGDSSLRYLYASFVNFNPRPREAATSTSHRCPQHQIISIRPREGRPRLAAISVGIPNFNPRPREVATRIASKNALHLHFNPRPRGGDYKIISLSELSEDFNPRPARGRQIYHALTIWALISIHAPARGDPTTVPCPIYLWIFNPRPPRGGDHHLFPACVQQGRDFNPPPRGDSVKQKTNDLV